MRRFDPLPLKTAKHQPDQQARREKWTDGYYRLYNSRTWRKGRLMHLAHEPLCRVCMEHGRVTAGVEVDHIIPHKGDPELFRDPDNWQTLCHFHHSQKTARESGFGGAGKKSTA